MISSARTSWSLPGTGFTLLILRPSNLHTFLMMILQTFPSFMIQGNEGFVIWLKRYYRTIIKIIPFICRIVLFHLCLEYYYAVFISLLISPLSMVHFGSCRYWSQINDRSGILMGLIWSLLNRKVLLLIFSYLYFPTLIFVSDIKDLTFELT